MHYNLSVKIQGLMRKRTKHLIERLDNKKTFESTGDEDLIALSINLYNDGYLNC